MEYARTVTGNSQLDSDMAFITPPGSKARVRQAGKKIADNSATAEDFELVDQWRSAHSYAINTFKVWLRRKITQSGIEAEFAQRLKRRNTVIDKLKRKKTDKTPLIHDVTTMQDFAGCRLIFKDIEDLNKFRNFLLSPKITENVNHRLKHEDLNKYNYIEHPKRTGYRGIHDVFLHFPRPHRVGEVISAPWQGLMVEVQYRTEAQHAWATALEISDTLDNERTKFGHGDDDRGLFFAMASEIIARRHEGMKRAFADKSNQELEKLFYGMEERLSILQRLGAMRQFDKYDSLRKHNVLNIYLNDQWDFALDVEVFQNSQDAIRRANELEQSGDSVNAVYVTGEPKQLRSAYRNYFNDPVDFVSLLKGEWNYGEAA